MNKSFLLESPVVNLQFPNKETAAICRNGNTDLFPDMRIYGFTEEPYSRDH